MWEPQGRVAAEDVRHIKSRVDIFRVLVSVERLKPVDQCAIHMSRWIRDSAALSDGRALVQRLPIVTTDGDGPHRSSVSGFDRLTQRAELPDDICQLVFTDLIELGAVDVSELDSSDWTGLAAWSKMKPLQQRRLLKAAGCIASHQRASPALRKKVPKYHCTEYTILVFEMIGCAS